MSDNSEAVFEDHKSDMLEDEEMPTFISVSSKDISLPYTDANMQLLPIDNSANSLLRDNETADDYEAQSRSPTTEEREEEGNDDNEGGSVYVLSSGDEADDADPSSRSYDEDVDEEEDVDDEDDEDIDDMDEIDPEEVGVAEDGQLLGDFSEEEIEREDVMSDDMALRSDKTMLIDNRKRSQSLQDLSEYGTLPRQKSYITGGNKYNRVQSKVRRYIQDLKEKNRRSMENRLKAMEDTKKCEEFEARVSRSEEAVEYYEKSQGRRSIKDYAEQALKDLEIREALSQEDENVSIQEEENCIMRAKNNAQAKGNFRTENDERERSDFNCDIKRTSEIHRSKKLNSNGEVTKDAFKNMKIPKGITVNCTLNNGQTQGQNIMDVRSIGYDEYMRGSSNPGVDKNVVFVEKKKKLTNDEGDTHKLEITNIRSKAFRNTQLKGLQNVEETPMEIVEHQEDSETVVALEKNNENNREALAQIAMIQTQLNQKTTQCKEIREAYEKTLSENFQLKQELEDLKKTLSKLSTKKPAPQLVAVAIQTDPPPLPLPSSSEVKEIPVVDNHLNPKASTSTLGSVFSSNEHWTESAGSLPTSNGSIRPLPNLTPLSNADDSFIGVSSTPPRTPRQPSHAFQTSSRIIKMLSSITQKKSRVDSTVNGEENSTNVSGKTLGTPGISSYNSPINHRGSNKRKASDMPENANFLQPPKIPHTASGSSRLHRRTRSEFKYPGDYIKLNSPNFTAQTSDANRISENLEDSRREDDPGEHPDSGVKCFTYRDDENSLEQSFLIQAEDESKNQDNNKDGERGPLSLVRECGPYLLGNLEVRMTEINGTINIWGKEVSQETTAEDESTAETDIDAELNERGTCDCWHKTPNPRHSSSGPMSCSTNKKLKIPPLRLNESGYLKNYHSPSTSNTKDSTPVVDNFKERRSYRTSDNDGNCQSCDSHINSRNVDKCKRFSNFGEEDHSKNFSNNYYGCDWEHENCDYTSCTRVARHCHDCDHDSVPNTSNVRGMGRCSRLNSVKDNTQAKTEENFNRNQSSRFNATFEDENITCRHGVRRNSVREDDDDVFKRPTTSNPRVNDGYCRNESCRSLSNQSNDPLLSRHSHETSEARRRRSSGKRVRGILMDFLRGCGDCRTTNGSDNKVSPSIVPQIRVRSNTPPPNLSSQTQQRTTNYGSTNERCVHMECCVTCSRRIEMAAEIETQLEIFGAEMERLRSRSQAVLGMLNSLHSADTN